ncbi:MAG TPA: 8-amino-7-oxononanoate synthase [Chryseolinea sp.]|nr:8-amino-7-oxononanoate synthase [Chryseolinea sp.]
MHDALLKRLQDDLRQREVAGLQRQLSLSQLIDFTSNDYLGLARSRDLSDMIASRSSLLHDNLNGATGSRLLSGNSELAEEVEQQLADIFKSETALLFNSGYAANLGVLSSLPQRNDTILYDERAHTSIKDGARLSVARRFSFRHNDLDDLENKLRRATGHCFVAVESIYSMDGDRCPLVDLVALVDRHNATIVLDEAHSTGIAGLRGEGMAVSLGVAERVGVRIYTFGKAMGCHGACVAGPALLREYFINNSRPFIYTTALPPHALLAISCAFSFLESRPGLAPQLAGNIAQFSQAMAANPAYKRSDTAIQCVQIPGNSHVNAAASHLRGKGFDVRPIRTPTVPTGYERIRICLHAFNEEEDIRTLADEINKLNIES